MVLNIRKLGLITGVALVIISAGSKCAAFPLPTDDIKRVGSSVQVMMQQIMQIKQEIESNLRIATEIANGGYAAAAGDLFAKIQNGDYDRFGNNLKGLQDSTYAATHSAKSVEERKAKQQAEREEKEKKILEEALKSDKIGKELAGKTYDQLTEEEKARLLEEHRKANQSFFERSYEWTKNNSVVTGAGLDAVNAAGNGDWSRVLEQGSISAGSAVGGANGSEISALGGVVSAGMDIVGNSSDLGEVITNTATSGKLTNNLNDLGATHDEYVKQEEKRKADEEAARQKEQEERLKQMQQITQELKQKACDECKAEAEKNPKKSCISACSL